MSDLGELRTEAGAGTPEPAGKESFDSRPMCRMSFIAVELELPSTNPAILLQELDLPFRELRITIGSSEGIAIAYAAKRIPTPKPLTHQLFAEVMEAFGLALEVVRITAVEGSSFFAELVLSGPQGSKVVQCRPSDAIALVLRQRLMVPIMVEPAVLDLAGKTAAG